MRPFDKAKEWYETVGMIYTLKAKKQELFVPYNLQITIFTRFLEFLFAEYK